MAGSDPSDDGREAVAPQAQDAQEASTRRDVLSTSLAVAAAGTAAVYACTRVAKFVNPPVKTRTQETFVAFLEDIPKGGTLSTTLPSGQSVQITRSGDTFSGFSDVCPHLGCRVHWVAPSPSADHPAKRNGWFRCPCHEGWFDAEGEAFAGPPKEAGMHLKRVDLVQRGGSLFVRAEVPVA